MVGCYSALAPAEDRALRGRNPSAAWRLANGRSGWANPWPGMPLPFQAQSEKSQGVWGTASPSLAKMGGMKNDS